MTDNDLNEQVNVTVDDASVITVPIDVTLSNSNEAADAKAVGDALALKADKTELQAAVKVNNQPADAQGLILIDGRHIQVSDQDTETLAKAVTDLKGKTAADIPMSSDTGAKTIAEVVNANSEAIEGMEEMTGATMPIESGSQTTVKAAIEARVKTVNRKAPDADGDVDLSVVPLAENLQSDKMESVEGAFIIRTTGGNASVSDGKAYPLHMFGVAEHTGYVAEELNMTVIPITRTEPDEPITATIDRDTFVAYVDESGTINLYYTTEWSEDPADYGITVTGTPVAGDQITVVYVKEVRGTITVADPARLVGTGWNLFDYNQGYARVVKYSTEYGYKVGGSYASLQFSATLTGERSSITPGADGLFNVNSDGYVFVTGGNNTDTYILATWSDWMDGPSSGYWEPYRESGIDLSAVMTTYFPNGLLAVGTTRDEIDLSAKRSISRIERMAYSEENRAAAAATGRSYDFDQNYIYIVRETPVLSAITIDVSYNVSEHGLEWFTETALPVLTEILYGKNLRDKLERDVLTISAQTLTEEEKAQARTNIGAMSQADGNKKLVAPTTGGTNGQLLKTNGDGTTAWTTQGTPTDAQVGTAVSAWLADHPEATTTVQDGAISRAKLNDDLKAKTDAVDDLKSAFINKTLAEYELIDTETDKTSNYYIKKSDGIGSGSTAWSFTRFIEIKHDYIMFTCPEHSNATILSNTAAIAYYRQDDTSTGSYISNGSVDIISGTSGNYDWIVVKVPAEAKYFRASIPNSIASNYKIAQIVDLTQISTIINTVVKAIRFPNYLRDKYNYAYGYIKNDGTIMINSSYPRMYAYFDDYIPVSTLESVAFICDYNNRGIAFAWYGTRYNFVSRTNYYPATDGTKQVVSIPSGAMYLRVSIMSASNADEYDDTLMGAHTFVITDGKNADIPLAYFEVPTIDNEQQYKGRKISILGDSISTFAGDDAEPASDSHTLADGEYTFLGNHCRYPNDYLTNVNDTYWKMLINELGLVLDINDSWAGSCVSWDGTEGNDKGADKYIASPTRIGHLDDNGTPDIILVNAGTNDIGKNVTIGTFNTESPKNYTDAQIAALPVATFADAYRALLIRLQKSYPLARIVVMLPNYTTSYYNPTEADSYLEIIKEACDYFGVPWIDMRTTGINMYNTGTYMGDGVHPNPVGMRMLYDKVLKFFQYSL